MSFSGLIRQNALISSQLSRGIQTSAILASVQSGRYKITPKRDRPLTYEMANPPHYIAHRKGWNSWNTSNLRGELRTAQCITEDAFIRKFMTGTWHSLVLSEVIIKRQFNHIRIAALIKQGISSRKMYFLIGYTEELLSYWLQCPVTLELQTITDPKDVIFKYI
ncbi:hypothetical protein ACKWTF_011566 [Chironomus riparius]